MGKVSKRLYKFHKIQYGGIKYDQKRLAKGACGLAMAASMLVGTLYSSTEAKAEREYANMGMWTNGDKREVWVDVGGYSAGYHCLYGYLNKTSNDKLCSWGQQKGYGTIQFSTFRYKTSLNYSKADFYARVKNELLSVK